MKRDKASLFWEMEATSEYHEDSPDGAYWQILRDTVNMFNDENNTKYDDQDIVFEWLEWREMND